jgi:hypothetical protein
LDGKIPKSGGPQKFVWGGRWDEFWKNTQADTWASPAVRWAGLEELVRRESNKVFTAQKEASKICRQKVRT